MKRLLPVGVALLAAPWRVGPTPTLCTLTYVSPTLGTEVDWAALPHNCSGPPAAAEWLALAGVLALVASVVVRRRAA